MAAFILQVLGRTPAWVWALLAALAALVALGIRQSKPRELTRVRLFALPLAMLMYSLVGMESSFGPQPAAWLSWGAALLLAVLLGRWLGQPGGVTHSGDTGRFLVPGSWAPLMLMLAIFCTRYLASVSLAIDAGLGQSLWFAGASSLVYGLLSGTLLARALHALGSKKRI